MLKSSIIVFVTITEVGENPTCNAQEEVLMKNNINIDNIDPIEDFPLMIERGDEIIIGMNPTILKDMQDYIEMENNPQSLIMQEHFERETLSIAYDIKAKYAKQSDPALGDVLAFRWAERKMGLREEVNYVVL